jgi:glycosyltransferase involved in cell wall biosynthesis
MQKPSVWVVIAAYNEDKVIADVLREMVQCNPSYNIIVVDDGSTDNTASVISGLPVYLLVHPVNLGQGAALATGINYALSHNADVVVTFDADGQMSPKDIDTLVKKVTEDGFDVALGSRFLNRPVEGMPVLRKTLLKLAVIFTRLTSGLKISDIHNGFRAFSAEAVRKITITQNRMAHASEILSQIASKKLKYCEVPVSIRYTEYSKAKGQTIWNTINILYELLTGNKK